MKHSVFLLLIIASLSCASSKNKLIMSAGANEYITSCADSINKIDQTKVIPSLVYSPCLDYQKRYWPNLHHAVSLRKLILEKVDNVKSIQYLLNLHDSKIREVCKMKINDTTGLNYYNIPFIDQSFEQLLKSRFEELQR